MAKEIVRKIQIVAMIENIKDIIEQIQFQGIIEAEDIEEYDKIIKIDTSAVCSKFEEYLMTARDALSILDLYIKNKKLLMSFFSSKTDMDIIEYHQKVEECDKLISDCFDIVRYEIENDDAKEQIQEIKNKLNFLRFCENADCQGITLNTKKSAVLVGAFPKTYDTESLEKALNEKLSQSVEFKFEIFLSEEMQTGVLIECNKKQEKELVDSLNSLGFSQMNSQWRLSVKKHIDSIEETIKMFEKMIEENSEKIKQQAMIYDDVKFLCDYLALRIEKYKVISKIAFSKYTFELDGYIPEKSFENFVREFEEKYVDIAIKATDFANNFKDKESKFRSFNPFKANTKYYKFNFDNL